MRTLWACVLFPALSWALVSDPPEEQPGRLFDASANSKWTTSVESVQSPHGREKRDVTDVNCDVGFHVRADVIDDGIRYLREKKDGLPMLCVLEAAEAPGKPRCGHISCSYGSAILLCNTDSEQLKVPCPYAASVAEMVLRQCRREDSLARVDYARGTAPLRNRGAFIQFTSGDC